LAAEAPLSIQAHPNPEQALAGFARENALGLALDAPSRNYKDDRAKPELIVALTQEFEALVGFASEALIQEKFSELLEASSGEKFSLVLKRWIALLETGGGLREVFLETLTSEDVDDEFISELIDSAEQCPALVDLVVHLAEHHGKDRGIATALLMNRMTLKKGEGVFVPAGMPHAYLSGLGVEVMLASDNVLRGGLTPKHIDVQELDNVLVFAVTQPERVQTKTLAVGFEKFQIPTPEFDFYRATVGSSNLLADINLPGDAIVLCTEGSVALSNSQAQREVLNIGEAAFMSGDARSFSLAGSGTVFIAVSAN
jgi:mannose-6-phosphate isomerase